ncbi:MAG: lytic murein transglycosylase B [Granulosicoccus sp.]
MRPLLRRLFRSTLISSIPWLILAVLFLFISDAGADNTALLKRDVVRAYIRQVSTEHNLDQNRIAGLFARLETQSDIIEAISSPAEFTLTWGQYRPIFIKPTRIEAGRDFLGEHQALLEQAEASYGVPATIIAAIIGVETFYGRITGKHSVLESLATLAFDYPPRADFFRSELTEFLVLSEAEGWDASSVKGSYAGAMGMPQFISSSYRQYAIDFDDDGKRDLFDSPADVIGSVANYLARHGWQRDMPVVERWLNAADKQQVLANLTRQRLMPVIAADTLRDAGFDTDDLTRGTAEGARASVMLLEGSDGMEGWVGYNNFYVITRYNHSQLYAMAVFQLAETLAASKS